MRRRRLIALAQPSFAAEEATVGIDNFAFTPAELTVRAGTKVAFVNRDDIPHPYCRRYVKFRSKALDTDQSFALVFDKPGEDRLFLRTASADEGQDHSDALTAAGGQM